MKSRIGYIILLCIASTSAFALTDTGSAIEASQGDACAKAEAQAEKRARMACSYKGGVKEGDLYVTERSKYDETRYYCEVKVVYTCVDAYK